MDEKREGNEKQTIQTTTKGMFEKKSEQRRKKKGKKRPRSVCVGASILVCVGDMCDGGSQTS